MPDHAAVPQRRGRRGAAANPRPGIPIVDSVHQIVGWTEAPPLIERGGLRHRAAERLLGGAIFCTEIVLLRPRDVVRAGGPAGWSGPWRCLALCPADHARGFGQTRTDGALTRYLAGGEAPAQKRSGTPRP